LFILLEVTARGLGVFKADQQLQTLIDTFMKMQGQFRKVLEFD
jgi:hypothetical protein